MSDILFCKRLFWVVNLAFSLLHANLCFRNFSTCLFNFVISTEHAHVVLSGEVSGVVAVKGTGEVSGAVAGRSSAKFRVL